MSARTDYASLHHTRNVAARELGGAAVYPFEAAHLADFVRWMRRYSEAHKRERDLADASLYWLARETGVTEILTVDVTEFSRYRLPGGKSFTLL
jgi:predicted nucleic acid-binding protein